MKLDFELSVDISNPYVFSLESLSKIKENRWVANQWPLVYLIENDKDKIAYIGESTNFLERVKNHIANPEKSSVLNKLSIIGSDKFNKSVTLDIESKLIQHLFSEGTYTLLNGNSGLKNHNYYQQDIYENLFISIWNKLKERKIVSKSIQEIRNSELFKYSPYKSLSSDQYDSVLEIISTLTKQNEKPIFINGSAGTGKTILATYLIKLLTSNISTINEKELNEDDGSEIELVRSFQSKYPNARIALVVAMSSLRTTLQNVFSNTPGLKKSMVISPSQTFDKKYDLLLVDEAHRLRQYKNISWRGAFKKRNEQLGLGESGTELDWILANSRSQVFFYDQAQSIKPSDVNSSRFNELLKDDDVITLELSSQLRSKGGLDYISFVNSLMNLRVEDHIFESDNYELLVFDSLVDLYEELKARENKFGLCRLVAGFSWPWLSDSRKDNPDAMDISIDGLEFQWNRTPDDWVNSPNAFNEVGSIHTTQGYDLNYTGLIFGEEIILNPKTGQIEIIREKYFDKYGKQQASDQDLKSYIINIYNTLMYRAIKGTFIYACDKNLREYFKRHINSYTNSKSLRILDFKDVKPFVNSVPLYDIQAAAGNFSELQSTEEDIDWLELPINVAVNEDYFVIKVVGESMNQKIPNGSYCLFKKYSGGSRTGQIVLAEYTNFTDSDFGSCYTVKEYESKKYQGEDGWKHHSIILKPRSTDPSYEDLILEDDELKEFQVIGVFERVLRVL